MHEEVPKNGAAGRARVAQGMFRRSELLLGPDRMRAVTEARGIIFGLGGVGSWCAESLVRTGLRHLTLVDSDRICVTNINRQIQATCATVGQVKIDALRIRLLDINPQAEIVTVQRVFDRHSAADFRFDDYDFVVDAIDTLSAKGLLLSLASQSRAAVFASLGAAAKLDPTRVRVAEFWSTKGCPLGAMLRKFMRRQKLATAKPIPTVYSDEVLANAGAGGSVSCGTDACLCPRAAEGPGDPALLNHEWCSQKARINGSVAHMTGIFGLTLAGLVIQSLACAETADTVA
jgi:tRNA A37 threonylcarbamoyladenosine dehydratase